MITRKLFETIRVALSQITTNKTRAFLTAIGITIGVAAVIILISLGQGVEQFVVSQFESLGSDIVLLVGRPSDDGGPVEIGQPNFTSVLSQGDVDLLSGDNAAIDVVGSAYTLAIDEEVTYKDRDESYSVEGINTTYTDIMQLEIQIGRGIHQKDIDRSERIALVGSDVVAEMFNGRNPIGETIRIGNVNVHIVGVLAESTNFLVDNDMVLIPISTAQRRLSGGRTQSGEYPITSIIFKAGDTNVDTVVDQIDTILRNARQLDADEPTDYFVFAQSTIVDTLTSITGLLTIFLAFIAGISLVVGGIGVMNIMLVTVTERTREIGLRKALGAQQSDILLQFLVESISVSVIGGLIGTLIAVFITMLVTSLVADFDITVQLSSILFAMVISTFIGGFFGVFPANRAAKMNPIDALRYE